jgi:hypothetical protein
MPDVHIGSEGTLFALQALAGIFVLFFVAAVAVAIANARRVRMPDPEKRGDKVMATAGGAR